MSLSTLLGWLRDRIADQRARRVVSFCAVDFGMQNLLQWFKLITVWMSGPRLRSPHEPPHTDPIQTTQKIVLSTKLGRPLGWSLIFHETEVDAASDRARSPALMDIV